MESEHEFSHYISYYTDDSTYTNHLVKEMGEMGVVTACERELDRARNRRSTRAPVGYTTDLDLKTPPENNRCGNCPWEDVADGE